MTAEYNELINNNTWTICNLPLGLNLIKNKWMFKLKNDIHGAINCYKARLVAKRLTQREGLDYKETFNSVVKFDSIRTILSIATTKDLEMTQFNVTISLILS